MRNFIFTIICILSLNFVSKAQTSFDNGFKEGFKNGYCYSANSGFLCTPPLPPLPPLPQITESRNSYQDGYNRGFLYGRAQRDKDDNKSSSVNSYPSPPPPKFNPYVGQSPILNLTPEERALYYEAKARQEQQSYEAMGAILESIFTVTPEGIARRAERKAKQYEGQKRKDEIKKIKVEQRKQAKIVVYGSEAYYKLKKSKNIWLGSAIGFSAIGTVSYFQSKSYYKKYQSATTDAEKLYNKVELYNKIYPIAFGLSGFCSLEVVLKSNKLSKADKPQTSLSIFSLENGGGIGLVHRF
jgi:hypothetical protein